MIGGIVVTNSRVITPGAQIKVVVQRIFQKQPVDLESKGVILARFENQFAKNTELLGQAGGNKEIKLSERECVGRPLLITRSIVNLGETLDLQVGRAAWQILMIRMHVVAGLGSDLPLDGAG